MKRRGILQGFCAAVLLSAIDIFGLETKEALEPAAPSTPAMAQRQWRIVPCSQFNSAYEGDIFTSVDPSGYDPNDAQRIFTESFPTITGDDGPGLHAEVPTSMLGVTTMNVLEERAPEDYYKAHGIKIIYTT